MASPLNIESPTLVTQITNKLREHIITGQLAPGGRIRQDEYAEAFGVSRTPLREAFRLLESEGWIRIRARSGVEVSRFSPDEVQQILSMRLLLEPLAIRISAVGHDDTDVDRLESLLKDLQSEPDGGHDEAGSYEAANQRFHHGLYGVSETSRSDPLHATLHSYWERYSRYRRVYYWTDSDSTAHSNDEHGRILQAWKDRDADRCERELAIHILRAGKTLVTELSGESDAEYSPALRTLADRYDFPLE